MSPDNAKQHRVLVEGQSQPLEILADEVIEPANFVRGEVIFKRGGEEVARVAKAYVRARWIEGDQSEPVSLPRDI